MSDREKLFMRTSQMSQRRKTAQFVASRSAEERAAKYAQLSWRLLRWVLVVLVVQTVLVGMSTYVIWSLR